MANQFFYDVFHKKLKPNSATSLLTFHNNNTINDVLVSHSNKETRQIHSIHAKVHSRNNMGVTNMDNFKKRQCNVTLKRLMLNPDGQDFKDAMDSKRFARCDSNDISGPALMKFETVKLKLEKGLFLTTDQFARDVRIIFCNAKKLHHMSHKIQRIAMKLSELFEMKWKSLEERWAAERQNNKEENITEVCHISKGKENVIKVCGSMSCSARNKRKFEFVEKCQNSVEKKVKKQHVLDTILGAQSNLFGCNDVTLERKKQREAAKLMIQSIKRTAFIDDNLLSYNELENLCGHSLQDCNKLNPLKTFVGLVLKDEIMGVNDLNEEKFLNKDWEEGEIIILD